MQVIGIVSTALIIQASGYKAGIWKLIQLWAIRPRASWFIGNMAHAKENWGYLSGALDNIMVEVTISGLGLVFLNNSLYHAIKYKPQQPSHLYYILVVSGLIMEMSILLEIIASMRIFRRLLWTKGRAKQLDVSAMKFVVRWVVPVTCVCNYLVWVAFLYSTKGVYCPGNANYVDAVWIVVPFITNLLRIGVEDILNSNFTGSNYDQKTVY